MRTMLIVGLILLAGLLATTPALGGWWWNAQLDVEGADVHLVWTVDDPDGANNYRAVIGFAYPKGAEVEIVSWLADKEQISLTPSPKLSLTDEGVQVRAELRIVPLNGADGQTASVAIVANGKVVASATGALRKGIVVSGVVPTK